MKSGRAVRVQGSVLILTLWALFFLGSLAVAVGAYVAGNLRLAAGVSHDMTGTYLARAGVAAAAACLACDTNGWDAPMEAWGDEDLFIDVELEHGMFSVRHRARAADGSIVTNAGPADEERRLNINHADEATLAALLQIAAEIDARRAVAVARAIVDWKDPDDNVLTEGAESGYYQSLSPAYSCHNGDFDSVRELMLVKGMDDALFSSVEPFVTVYGSGLVNVNTAGREVLLALALSGSSDVAACHALVGRLIGAQEAGVAFRSRRDLMDWRRSAELSAAEGRVFSRMAPALDVQATCFRGEAVGRVAVGAAEAGRIVFVYDRRKRVEVFWYEF